MKLNNNKRTIHTWVSTVPTLKKVILDFCSSAAPLYLQSLKEEQFNVLHCKKGQKRRSLKFSKI